MKTKTHPDTIYNLTVYDARKTVHLYDDGSRSFKYKILMLLIALLLFLI